MEENSYESRSIVSNLKGNKTNVYDFDRVSLFFYNLDFPIFRRVRVCVRASYLYILSTFKIGVLRFSNRETCARDFL